MGAITPRGPDCAMPRRRLSGVRVRGVAISCLALVRSGQAFVTPLGLHPPPAGTSCAPTGGFTCRIPPGGHMPGRCHAGWGLPRQRVGRRGTRALGMMFDELTEKLSGVAQLLQGRKKITEASVEGALQEVKRALLDADVNLKVTNRLVEAVKTKAVGAALIQGVTPEQQFVKIMYDELVEVMGSQQTPLARREEGGGPTVILMAGLQGAGKTTAAAKLTKFLQEEGETPRKVLLVAGDIYRPAAIEQLEILGDRINATVFSLGRDVDPVEIALAGVQHAKENAFDTVIVDTAGRQVVDDKLMDELKEVRVAVEPDEVLLVVDAMTGQEAATLTAVFDQKIGITGALLTKLDGDLRGGSALSVQGVSGKPIKFVGVGEKLTDLEPFYPERMASRILGMGDVVSLVEKAQKQVSEAEAKRLTEKMMDATFDFDDFIKQNRMMKNMGSMAGVAKMLPGMAGKITDTQMEEAEVRLERAETIIQFMSPEERSTPDLLIRDTTATERLRRISQDAGLMMSETMDFISDFERMRTMMSRMSKNMGGGGGDGGPAEGGMMDPSSLMGDQQAASMALGNRSQRRQAKKGKKAPRARGGFGR